MRRITGGEPLFTETRKFNKMDKNFHWKGLCNFVVTGLLKWRDFKKQNFAQMKKNWALNFTFFIVQCYKNVFKKH